MPARVLCVLTALLLPGCWCGEDKDVFSEHVLYSSSLWRKNNTRLVLVQKDATVIPANYLEYVTRNLSEDGSLAKIVKVECLDGEEIAEGGICSLLLNNHLVLRLSGGQEGLIGRKFPFADYETETQFLVDILESFAGRSLSHFSNHSSLSSFLQAHSEVLVALVPDSSKPEYGSLLASYLVHRPDALLAIVSSVFSLPLSKRPRHSANPHLLLWNVLHSGSAWYTCPGIGSIQNFLIRTSYPEKIVYEKNRGILKEFKKRKVTYVLFFPPLPEAGPFNFDQIVDKILSRVYSVYVVVTVDRKISRKLAKHHFVSESNSQGHVVALPYGRDENAVGLDMEAGNAREEYGYIVETLLEVYKESQALSSLKIGLSDDVENSEQGDDKVPTISITDFSAMAIAIEHFKTDLVFVFCEQDAEGCPDDLFISLEKAHRAVLQAQLKTVINFFVVECRSVDNVKKYKLDRLPSYAIYHRAKKTMVPGTGDVHAYKNILSLISEVTGIKELVGVEPMKTETEKGADDLLRDLSLEEEAREHDMYGRIAQTLPPTKLPKKLVLTDENFSERIGLYEKTAVMFYMTWSVKSRVALHHLAAAYDRLDKKSSVALGCVACDFYIDLCTHYNVTIYPSVFIFTPATLSNPTPFPPSIGVTDSVHFLKALSVEQEAENILMELTPATMPVIMKKSLETPLVLWCDSSRPTSDLGIVFTDVALSDTSKDVAYAWMNCKKYGRILEDVLEIEPGNGCHNVFGFRLHQHTVYQLDMSAMQLESAGFRDALLSFIQQLRDRTLQSRKILPMTDWLPLEPPIYFPSSEVEGEQQDVNEDRSPRGRDYNGKEIHSAEPLNRQTLPNSELKQGDKLASDVLEELDDEVIENHHHHLGDEL